MPSSTRLGTAAVLASVLMALSGCEGARDAVQPEPQPTPQPQPEPGPSNLVIESSVPEREATLTNSATVSIYSREHEAHLYLAQDVGDLHHWLLAVWDVRTREVLSVSHEVFGWWDYGEGNPTACSGAQCAGAIVIDDAGRTATFTGLMIVAPNDPAKTSTLDGTVGW